MKNIKYLATSGAMLLLSGILSTSCVDGNDWEVDGSYDRLFSVPKGSISAEATEAELTWTKTPGTEYHLIEVSKDSLYDAIPMGTTEGSIVYGEDKTIAKSPFTLTGLDSSSKYFLRIKAMSDAKESKWSYITDYSFKTKSEQIMENVGSADVTAFTATIKWLANATVTHIEVIKDEELVKKIELTQEQMTEGTIVLDGLEQLTNYVVNIYNNDIKRGSVTFQTPPDVPAADWTEYLNDGDSINQDLFDKFTAEGYKNVTIALSGDAKFINKNKLYLPNDVSLTFFGLPGSSKPIIAVQMFELGSKHAFVKFQNVELSAYGVGEDGNPTTNSYIFNQGATATSVGTLEFDDCVIRDFKNTPIRMQGTAVKIINTLTINNCIIYGAKTRTYSIVHIDANKGDGKIENIAIENSTIVYTGKSFIYSRYTDMQSISIKNCTFSKAPGEGDYIVDFDKEGQGATEGILLENNIFGSIGGTAAKGIRGTGTVTVINSYNTTDWSTTGNAISNLTPYEGGEADLFTDPANFDFTIKDNSFEGKRSCGDPRWYMP